MKTADAKKWLAAKPTFRELPRYDGVRDTVFTMYVPRLCGKDVCLSGRPTEFVTSMQAVAEAKRFQSAVRKNHPEIN